MRQCVVYSIYASLCAIAFLLLIEVRSIVDYVMIFKGRGLKMGVFVGGGGGGGVDLDLDFKNFWDGVYNFFFCPPLAHGIKNFC